MNRTINTAAELEALPAWAAVEDALGVAWVKHPAMPGRAAVWVSYYGEHGPLETPLTVLHDPSVVPEAAAPSAIRDEVEDELLYAAPEDWSVPGAARDLATALLARFNITPKEADHA